VSFTTILAWLLFGSRSSSIGQSRSSALEGPADRNEPTLTWDASPAASGYEVLWRQTTSADWEQVQSAGNQTRVTLPQSKDNVIFAVRAFDSLGHRSLPVIPVPEP